MKHTATPWTVFQAKASLPAAVTVSGYAVATNVRRVDAEFIVCACNAHDDLVAAAKLALALCDRLAKDDDCTEGQPETAHALRAALAKAEAA